MTSHTRSRRPASATATRVRRRRLALLALALCVSLGAWVAAARGPASVKRIATHIQPSLDKAPAPHDGPIGLQDGYVAVNGSISPFADVPAITRLDPPLRQAIQHAATDARVDHIDLRINSGWRSARYQQLLLDRAIQTYGSEQEARRHVDSPTLSHHVTGRAVDVGPTDADSWLSQHGATYGLCQTYANELWHYELATRPGGTCPVMRANASDG